MEELGGIELPPLFHGRYNVAPSQKVAAIRQDTPTRAEECIWGFENPRSGTPIINARSETLSGRAMFKDLLSHNRCLIPADGFFEWKGKQPYYFQLPKKQSFAFAGLWRDGHCVIITRAANRSMQGIHDRMPVILESDQWNHWLQQFRFIEPPTLTARPVSRRINKVANDDLACLVPGEVQADLSLFPDGE